MGVQSALPMSSPRQTPAQSGGGPWRPPPVEHLQSLLPSYDVLELLGCGGMGAVYKARQKSLKRLVAIKVLPPGLADDGFKFAERFQNEAQTLAQMNHPAIVSVYDFGETPDGLLYFVMEFVDGTDVQQMIHHTGRLSPDHALAITAHVCDALAYAHKRGVIHRDIKPANILIDDDGHVKVADFGLAKMHDPSQTSGLTRTNVAMGTPDYVAPEVLTPGVLADHRADLYAVGVMLYQMLTGEVPRGMFKLPSEKGDHTDPRFDEIIVRAMEQDREQRYQSAADVRDALEVIRTTPMNVMSGTSLVPAPAPKLSKVTRQLSARLKWLVAIVLLSGLGGAGLIMLERNNTSLNDVAPSTSYDPDGSTIDWINAPPKEKGPWAREWNLKGGTLTPATKLRRLFGVMKDGVVRIRVRLLADYTHDDLGPLLQLTTRSGSMAHAPSRNGHVQFQTYVPNRTASLHFQDKTTAGLPVEPLLTGSPKKVSELGWREVEWEFRAIGDEYSAWADGELVATVRDPKILSGYCMLEVSPGIQISKLETVGLTIVTSSATPAAEAKAKPPAISRWEDATEILRQQARKSPDLVVDAGAIRHSGSTARPILRLPRESTQDLAVRLTYSGDGQVNWRSPPGGMLYVLCQRDKTIIQRHDRGANEPSRVLTPVAHPAHYDPKQTHELLVTLQGPLLRAWVDGRFIGEVRDEEYAGGPPEVALSKWGDVRKVEIAKLNDDSTPPVDNWTDWLGPKLVKGFTSEGWVLEDGGVTTDLPLKGTEIMPRDTRNGVIRATFAIRDSEGVMLTARETPAAKGKDSYVAQFTGKNLYIAHTPPDATRTVRLVNEPVSEELRALPEHTLEFRFEGEELTAVLDGRLRISTRHSLLSQGISAVVLTKGVLLKKLETRSLE